MICLEVINNFYLYNNARKGGARNFSYPGLLIKYIIFKKDKLLTHVHEFLKLTVKF